MKISEQWLRTWVNPAINSMQLAEQLTQAGLEIEGIAASAGDCSLELNITPNRGDCLSIAGIAREVAALNRCSWTAPEFVVPKPASLSSLPIEIKTPAACPQYTGCVISGMDVSVSTPDWIAKRLQAAGIRSISVVVDITNYVMLELGQPLHAFDYHKIKEGIQVRFAKAGESLTLLDQQTVDLSEQTLVIADATGPLAIAGVMGGLASSVTADTSTIFLEAAFFSPLVIAGQARRYNLQSDAAFRFERGVDPLLPEKAMARAVQLIIAAAGGECSAITVKTAAEHLPSAASITLRQARLNRVLGTAIDAEAIATILQYLGMQVTNHNEGWQVQVPSWRFDVQQEIDLIEEIARIVNYNNIPAKAPAANLSISKTSAARAAINTVNQLLINRGYHEAITYSFIPQAAQALFAANALALANPLSAELAVMRTSLWPGLLRALSYNLNRQQQQVRLFESGLSFHPAESGLQQQLTLAGLCSGSAYPEQWGLPKRTVDFFDLKGDVESLLSCLDKPERFSFKAADHTVLQPGQSCAINYQDQTIGYLGALNKAIAAKFELEQAVYLFELNLDCFTKKAVEHYQYLSKFPSIRRDLAFLVRQEVTYQQIKDIILKLDYPLLTALEIFDVYQGKGIQPGYKSIAISIMLQHPERTLVEDEINQCVNAIIIALTQTVAAELRG